LLFFKISVGRVSIFQKILISPPQPFFHNIFKTISKLKKPTTNL
jgi:hypothetical protein